MMLLKFVQDARQKDGIYEGEIKIMNIREVTMSAIKEDLFIRKRDRTENWTLYVGPGSVYRFAEESELAGQECEMDARDCVGDDWYLVDEEGQEVLD